MSKSYIEMTNAEMIFNRISNDLDWSTTMMIQGVLTEQDGIKISQEDFELYSNKALDFLMSAYEYIEKLRNALIVDD